LSIVIKRVKQGSTIGQKFINMWIYVNKEN
jgi:hypothetical protein